MDDEGNDEEYSRQSEDQAQLVMPIVESDCTCFKLCAGDSILAPAVDAVDGGNRHKEPLTEPHNERDATQRETYIPRDQHTSAACTN